jgi:Na+/H+-translocating membrane pyrophosphatase
MTVQTSAQAGRSALRKGLIAWAFLTVALCAIGYLLSGEAGVWGALLASVLAGSFFAITAAVAALTANLELQYLGFAVLGSWLLKIVVLLVALFWLRSQDFYDRPIFFVTLLLETVVLLILEAVLVTRAPVPYVEVDR